MENVKPPNASTVPDPVTTPSAKLSIPNLATCTPGELAAALRQRIPSTTHLQQFMADLNKACGTSPVAPITPTPSAATLTIPDSFGSLVFTAPKVQFITPRGRFDVSVYSNGVVVKNAKGEGFLIEKGNATHAVTFAKPDIYNKDPNKVTSRMLLLNVSPPAPFKKSSLSTICIQAETKDVVTYTTPKKEEDSSSSSGSSSSPTTSTRPTLSGTADSVWFPNICHSISAKILTPSLANFKSSTGFNFVQCYNKVNQGSLYPMIEGLLFFKPPFFVPRQKLNSIGAGRGGGGGTKYIDMMVMMEGSKSGDPPQPLEFTNINREELGPLNTYINDILKPAMVREITEGDAKPEVHNVDQKEEVVEAEVIDVEMDTEEVGRKRPRSGRGAAKVAMDATRAQMAGGNYESDEDEDDSDEGDYVDSEEDVDDSGDESGDEEEGGGNDCGDGSGDSDDSDDEDDVFADCTEEDLMKEIEATIHDAGEDSGSNKKQKL